MHVFEIRFFIFSVRLPYRVPMDLGDGNVSFFVTALGITGLREVDRDWTIHRFAITYLITLFDFDYTLRSRVADELHRQCFLYLIQFLLLRFPVITVVVQGCLFVCVTDKFANRIDVDTCII